MAHFLAFFILISLSLTFFYWSFFSRNSTADTLIWLDNTRKVSGNCLLILLISYSFFMYLPMVELIKLPKMAGVMHEVDHTYSTTHLVIALISYQCTIDSLCFNSPCTFIYCLDLSNFILEVRLSCFRVLINCLLLVYFVSAAGCHCCDLIFR